MQHLYRSWVFLLIFSVINAHGQTQQPRGPSTPEERARFVTITHKFEANPLDPALREDREWAVLWLIQVPDVRVKMCTEVLGPAYNKEKYSLAPEITAQMLLSSGSFVIENPDKANDNKAQYVAAANGVLNAYQSILRQKPEAKSKALDELLQKQRQGKLKDFVGDAAKKCK